MYKIPTMHNFDSLITIDDDWPYHSKRLRHEYPHLTDADVLYESGKENELMLRLVDRLNISREEVIRLLRNARMDRLKGGSPW